MSSPEKKNIVIIGGGIIGCSTAFFLSRHPAFASSGSTITLLEATSIAAGASGKAGGLLALWAYPRAIVPLSFRLHKELAEEFNGKERWGYRGVGVGRLEVEGRKVTKVTRDAKDGDQGDGFKKPIETTHAADPAPVGNGAGESNTHARQSDDVSLGKEVGIDRNEIGEKGVPKDLDWVDMQAVTDYESMGDPTNTAQVHPYQFTTSIAKLAEQNGVKIVIGKAEEVIVANGAVQAVEYRDSRDKAEKIDNVTDVIVTAGPWSKHVWPGAPIGALRAHSVCIRPSKPVSAYCLFTEINLPRNFKEGAKNKAMTVSPELYARPNNEVYACGEGDHLVPLPATAADVEVDKARCQDIIDYCASFSDEMRDGEVLVRQACYLPQVEYGGGPLIGPTRTKGVWLAAGHTCWGIQNGPATGKLMSEFIFDGEAKSASIASLDPRHATRR